MPVWYTFRYAEKGFNADDIRNEHKYVSSAHFEDLFEVETFFLLRKGLNLPFVKEYKVNREPTLTKEIQDYREGKSKEKQLWPFMTYCVKRYILKLDYLQKRDYWRGPSKPIPPDDLKKWAQNWLKFFDTTDPSDVGNILEDEGAEYVGHLVADLEHAVRLAENAKAENKKLVMEVTW